MFRAVISRLILVSRGQLQSGEFQYNFARSKYNILKRYFLNLKTIRMIHIKGFILMTLWECWIRYLNNIFMTYIDVIRRVLWIKVEFVKKTNSYINKSCQAEVLGTTNKVTAWQSCYFATLSHSRLSHLRLSRRMRGIELFIDLHLGKFADFLLWSPPRYN